MHCSSYAKLFAAIRRADGNNFNYARCVSSFVFCVTRMYGDIYSKFWAADVLYAFFRGLLFMHTVL